MDTSSRKPVLRTSEQILVDLRRLELAKGLSEETSECAMGFSRVEVARTRILQGSQLQVTGLSKGVHNFQCCIHPWMRTTVVVK